MKNKMLLIISLLATLTGFSPNSWAAGGKNGWELNPALMYLYESTTNSGSTTSKNRYLADIDFGYVFTSPIFLGFMLAYDNLATSSSSGTTKDTFLSYGPSFGLSTENLFMTFTYFLSSEYDHVDNNGTTTAYTNASGYQLDFGYRFNVGASWSVGPQLSYKTFHYTQQKTNASSSSADYTYSTLLPFVSLSFSL